MKIVDGKLMYEVGDTVTILPYDKFPVGEDNHVGTSADMSRFAGVRRRIISVTPHSWGYSYTLYNMPFNWENTFFEDGRFVLSRDTGGSLKLEGLSDFISTFVLNV